MHARALPIHPTLRHPITGERLQAIGYFRGRPIWPILGGDENAGGGGEGSGAGQGGAGGEGGQGAGAGAGSGQGGTGGGSGGEGGGGSESNSNYTPPQTQADFDKAINERLSRERAKYADYETLKQKAAKHDADEAKKAPEIERIQKAAREEGETAATERSNARLVQFAARAQLAEAKAINPATAVKTLDVSAVKVDKDGVVDEAALTAAIDALKKSDAYLFGNGSGSASDAGVGAGGGGGGQRPTSLGGAIDAHYAGK